MRPTLLVDGNNLLVRAVEATRRAAMTSPSGVSTAALVVMARTLSRYIRGEVPYKVIVLWDRGYARRAALYPPYKAARPQAADDYRSTSKQLVQELLQLCRVQQHSVPGEEADDLIAEYWRTATTPVVILSNDKDLLQLVGQTPTGHDCEQIRISSANTPTDRWGEREVREHFGCTPAQIPVAMSLAGDSVDGIPGIPGFGMKTAVKHLAAADWNLDAVTHPHVISRRDEIALYRQLVDLRDIPLGQPLPTLTPFMPVTVGPDRAWAALNWFLADYHLNDLRTRMIVGEMWH